MQQHPVPQNIKEFNFKLFGNLTTKQFITLVIIASPGVLIFFSNIAPLIRYPLSALFGFFAIVVALVPIQGRPFDKWIMAFVRAVFSPTQRLWVKETAMPRFLNIVVAPASTEEKIPEEVSTKSRERLVAYLKSLPKDNASPLDLKEQMAIAELDMTTAQIGQGTLPPPVIWPTQIKEEPRVEIKIGEDIVKPRVATIKPAISEIEAEIERLENQAAPRYKNEITDVKLEQSEPLVLPKFTPAAKAYTIPAVEDRLREKAREGVRAQKQPMTHLASDTNFTSPNLIPLKSPYNKIKLVRGVASTRVRKLHFAPPENFDLSKLPIRGERRFEISKELAKRFHFEEDTPAVVLPNKDSSIASINIQLPNKKQEISRTLPKATTTSVKKTSASIKKPEPIKVSAPQQDFSKFSMSNTKQTNAGPNVAQPVQIIPLTSNPNVISGLVTDTNGAPLEAAVLVVRDSNGVPLRALKTNKLGQFLSATPLGNGTYTIEIESEHVKFEPASVSLVGEIVPPIGIKGSVLK